MIINFNGKHIIHFSVSILYRRCHFVFVSFFIVKELGLGQKRTGCTRAIWWKSWLFYKNCPKWKCWP